jgi:hypothetical protein
MPSPAEGFPAEASMQNLHFQDARFSAFLQRNSNTKIGGTVPKQFNNHSFGISRAETVNLACNLQNFPETLCKHER